MAEITDSKTKVESPVLPLEGELLRPGNVIKADSARLPSHVRTPARKWRRWSFALVIVIGAAGGGHYWWRAHVPALPAGIVVANGRLEAEQIDISTKFAGRVAELRVAEGDEVQAGQVVARMDTRDLEATLNKDIAQQRAAERAIVEARANEEQQRTQVSLAKAELDRTSALLQRGYATHELFDQRRQALDGANAALNAASARAEQAERVFEAVQHDIEYIKVNIADNTLIAPRPGRIQYRIANIGEVLPAGGKVFTMLDVSDVYMDVYLPTADAGRAHFGTDARIILDAYPQRPIPAHVSFIATQAQFTPKAVETRTERDKLMFRVKLRVNADILQAHAADVRSGLPGLGYLRLDPNLEWPESLKGKSA